MEEPEIDEPKKVGEIWNEDQENLIIEYDLLTAKVILEIASFGRIAGITLNMAEAKEVAETLLKIVNA